jgi:hypothetical protein
LLKELKDAAGQAIATLATKLASSDGANDSGDRSGRPDYVVAAALRLAEVR